MYFCVKTTIIFNESFFVSFVIISNKNSILYYDFSLRCSEIYQLADFPYESKLNSVTFDLLDFFVLIYFDE